MNLALKRLLQGGVIGLASAGVVLAIWRSGELDGLEGVTWSWRVHAFAPRLAPSPQIKAILLDQASLEWGKQANGLGWPWPREVYAPILDFCRRGGAKVVVFDMLVTEPSTESAEDDARLGQAIRRTQTFVGALFLGGQSGVTNWPIEIPTTAFSLPGLETWSRLHPAEGLVMPRATFPIPEVATNSAMLADVSVQPDGDGSIRRAALFRVFDGKIVPSPGLAAYLVSEKAAGRTPSLRVGDGWLQVGTHQVPIDKRGTSLLRFSGRHGTHESYSAAAVIQSELRLQTNLVPVIDPAIFTNAFVFFGTSAPGLFDAHPSPISRAYPGLETHATCLEDLLGNSFLRDIPSSGAAGATLFLGLVSGAVITLSRKARHTVLGLVCLLPIPALAGFLAYPLGWWWPIVVTELAVALALIGGIVLNYATEGRQKVFLKRAFQHYLGEEVIEQLIVDPQRLKLGGEKRELTIFFSDIEKFSTFSEKLDPATLTSLLNEYLSEMTGIILEEGGYLDKYIGDAIVAFWNAPVLQPDHAIRAVRAVLRCQRRLQERREYYQAKSGVKVKARIGLHTGEVTVGNMGSVERFNYTVLGDAANLASRLEGANKVFGTYNLVSEATWSQTVGQFQGRELGRIRVLGRQQPVRVYEILGLAGEPLPGFVTDFQAGLKRSLAGQWQEALTCFERQPQDSPSAAYAVQCRNHLAGRTQEWDGIWNLTEK